MRWTLVLFALYMATGAAFVEEVEVEVAVDGSVVAEKGPLYAAAGGVSAKSEGVVEIAAVVDPEPQKSQQDAAAMTILQQELATLEQMINLQDRKLQMLQKMRSNWLQEQEGQTVQQRATDVAQIVERRLDAVFADSFATSEKDFDTYFVERASSVAQKQIVDVKMAKIHATSAVELIAVAFADGQVVFSTSTGEELLTISTERQGVKAIALASQEEQLCLVMTYEAAVVALYKLNLVNKESHSEAGEKKPLGSMIGYSLSIGERHDVQLSSPASAVAIARSSRQLVVAVAQNDGVVDFLALNGSSLRQMQTNATINAMKTKRSLLAFSNGTDVVVSSMTRAQGSIFHSCLGSSAKVSSIAFDAVHPDILYTGTQRGEVLVYAVNAGAPAGGQGCRLLSRSMATKSSHEFTPVALATTQKYVIAAGPQDITVFNVSRSQQNGFSLSRICTNHLENVQSNGGNSAPAMSFSEGVMGSNFAFVTATSGGLSKFLLFHCLLSEEKDVSDSTWTIFLFAAVVLAGVVGSQLFIRWQKQSNVNPWDTIGKPHAMPYGKYGGIKDNDRAAEFDGEDFGHYNSLSDELRRKIAQAKRGADHRPIDDEADY